MRVEVAVLGFRPNEPYGFCGRKATLNHAYALVTVCPYYINRHPGTLSSTSSSAAAATASETLAYVFGVTATPQEMPPEWQLHFLRRVKFCSDCVLISLSCYVHEQVHEQNAFPDFNSYARLSDNVTVISAVNRI